MQLPPTDFHLIETMRVSGNGEVFLLDRHLNRLRRSAAHFGFHCNLERLRSEIVEAAAAASRPACLRLTLPKEGLCTLETRSLPGCSVRWLKLSTVRVDSKDEFLYHKTSNRGLYKQAHRECDEETDAILVNEQGAITETTIMNVAVFRDGRWITPELSCGLLPGIMREELLSAGQIEEGIIPAGDLRDGESVQAFNAVRGVCEARLRLL